MIPEPAGAGPLPAVAPVPAVSGSSDPGRAGPFTAEPFTAELAEPTVGPVTVVEPVIPVLNIANMLTAARVLLVPVFGVFLVASELENSGWRIAATVAFAVASLTDYVDGWIARRHNLVTSFGKVADPIADKALIGTALVLLSVYDAVPWWVTLLVLVREFGITAMRFLVLRHGVIPASQGGKLKTMLQSIGIGWLVLPLPGMLSTVGLWIVYAAMVVTVVTGVDYVVRAWRLSRSPVR